MRPLDFLDLAADTYADRIALVIGDTPYTYAQVNALSHSLARGLQAHGLRAQDRIAIYSSSDARAFLCMFAIMRAGGVVVPVNAAMSLDSSRAFLSHVQARWLFAPEALIDRASELQAGVPSLTNIWSLGLDPNSDRPSLASLQRDGGRGQAAEWADSTGNLDRIVTIAPTSGTSGLAKGVAIRTAAYTSYLEAYRRFLAYDDDRPVSLTASQLTPASLGMAVVMYSLGACQRVMPTFNATHVLETIETRRVTHLWLPPTGLAALLNCSDRSRRDLSSLRALVTGGASVSPAHLREAATAFGASVCHTYGQMETGTLAWLDSRAIGRAVAGDHPERLASCGRINDMMRVAVMDSEGELLPSGRVGEVVARGRGISEYFGDPVLTVAARRHGWHRTGDLGYIDADRYLFIVGRIKDLVITGGCNVRPAEVERCILDMPEVDSCAVVGLPDDLLGEVVTAVVVTKTAARLSADEVNRHCRNRLGAMQAPKRILFRNELPMTAAGKIDKIALRATLLPETALVGHVS